MDFKTSIETCLKRKYVCFEGRASRSEYWYFFLFHTVAYVVATIIGSLVSASAASVLSGLVALALLLPLISAMVRRIHDIDKSGWLGLLALVPIINLVLIFFLCKKGTQGSNKFGKTPVG